jgi:hypothetical protein
MSTLSRSLIQLEARALARFWTSYGFLRAVPLIAGPGIAAAAIFWVHGSNLANHGQNYAQAPPTISRALLDPNIARPFAFAMAASAIFLVVAVFQVASALGRRIKRTGQGTASLYTLLLAGVVCEMIAIAGMVVLSQFTGQVNPRLHDIGSYMLFFGHAIGISLVGLLIRRLISVADRHGAPSDASPDKSATLRKHPRRAGGVAVLSVLYGVVYFGGKQLPDMYFFWQRTIMSVLEVFVILSFLGFLAGFGPLLGIRALGGARPAPEVSSDDS